MTETLEERLALARAARREQQWVTQRLTDAGADRERVTAQLEATAVLVASEAADVDRLANGVGGFFRRLFAGRADLSNEQRELAAATLQHEALTDEQRAIDVDLAQLAARATVVRDADARYAAVLAEVEAKVAHGGPHTRQLAALAETDGQLRAAHREVQEAIAAGRAAHAALVEVQQAVRSSQTASFASDQGSLLARDLGFGALTATAVDLSEHVVHDGLRTMIAAAQRAMSTFQRECKDVAPVIDGIDVTPLPGLISMVARDLVWTTSYAIDDVGAEIELLSSYVATSTMELRGREQQLQRALAGLVSQRAAVLDPDRERL